MSIVVESFNYAIGGNVTNLTVIDGISIASVASISGVSLT